MIYDTDFCHEQRPHCGAKPATFYIPSLNCTGCKNFIGEGRVYDENVCDRCVIGSNNVEQLENTIVQSLNFQAVNHPSRCEEIAK